MIYPPKNVKEQYLFFGLAVERLIISTSCTTEELGILTGILWVLGGDYGDGNGGKYYTSYLYKSKDEFLKKPIAKAIEKAKRKKILKVKFFESEHDFFFRGWAGKELSLAWDKLTLTEPELHTIFLAKGVLNENPMGLSKNALMKKIKKMGSTGNPDTILGNNALKEFLPKLNGEYLNLKKVKRGGRYGTEIYTPLKTKQKEEDNARSWSDKRKRDKTSR